MVSAPRLKNKTYDDYLAMPEGTRAELIDGELYMSPQPKGRHIRFASNIGSRINVRHGSAPGPGDDGPGGWWIFFEPEVHLRTDRRVFVPDIAGWRRERMPEPPIDTHKFLIVPDWVCEVLSPSTLQYDFLVKMPRYLEAGVPWVWLVNTEARRIDVMRAIDGEWAEAGSFEGDIIAHIPPFEDTPIDLRLGWSG